MNLFLSQISTLDCFYRRPFGKDEDRIEYDYDSNEDWDEEEKGESLSDDGDDKEEEEQMDDYEVDNEYFVPTGYLSDEEEDKDEDEVLNPKKAMEKVKEKRMHTETEFEKERKKKTRQLMPRLSGVCFEGDSLDTKMAVSQPLQILSGFRGILIGNNSIETGLSKTGTCKLISINKNYVFFLFQFVLIPPKIRNPNQLPYTNLARRVVKSRMFLRRLFLTSSSCCMVT